MSATLAPDDAIKGTVEPDELRKCRVTYGAVKRATYTWALACQAAKEAGHSLRRIAEATGETVSKDTVGRALRAVAQCDNADDFDREYAAVVKRTNGSGKPKPVETEADPAPAVEHRPTVPKLAEPTPEPVAPPAEPEPTPEPVAEPPTRPRPRTNQSAPEFDLAAICGIAERLSAHLELWPQDFRNEHGERILRYLTKQISEGIPGVAPAVPEPPAYTGPPRPGDAVDAARILAQASERILEAAVQSVLGNDTDAARRILRAVMATNPKLRWLFDGDRHDDQQAA